MGQSHALIELQVFLGARRAIALACFFVAQAGEFVAAVDAIAIARL